MTTLSAFNKALDDMYAPGRWARALDPKRIVLSLDAWEREDHKGSRKAGKKVVFKQYVVRLDGNVIGTVAQAREHCYRMAGRLSYGSTYPLRWIQNDTYQLYYATRQAALIALLEDHYRKGV